MTNSGYSVETIYSQLIRSIAIKMKLSSDEKVKKLGLNSQQGRMIGYIYEHQDSGIIQKDLAKVFQRTEASITSMLQGLEKKGYIERRIPKENERQKNIYVLPKGAELIEDFNKLVVEEEENIIANLTEQEKETLLALLLKVDRNI
ncbi:DNA-binding MarR family transcriptional regulator [Clostridium saccharoperbutylacetonicum]|uniref:Transcriptional regulator, MarR family n=1 Tax=Clostridium saccharoperbutylacetonicum N1-4(HMT) TaxID=931276 RepID=M1MVS5_9CLOT|nr:MarR family transcriptional regulator [Clostridium saccharoperbutylacetonicum]AGF55617.1 transcriptional regulator, MarR family [Clostridium saccharoperbutylacetonicum N1-4(HMT)]NRT63662.1 DNA-binding MarR family transcriptional regulator [Clostridium saccharoperbutylacetonicum]NSB27025.1 DNA-binding MarR family transcriptional regulator [Clostridium saccharoperbutylacetonicum]NSB40509.1 DNA-binding MarR family transcriptional regulator [Clostridium saccharoperbutylacetonicum]